MKRIVLLSIVFFTAQLAFAQSAKFMWENKEIDFGKIKKDVPVTYDFKFVNGGKKPLIITNVNSSCGCSVPSWSRDPIPPSGHGYVRVRFNAASMGNFHKTMTISANVEGGSDFVSLKGEVVISEPTSSIKK